jgi:hypothetical protein
MTTASHIIRRAQRQSSVTLRVDAITAELRALCVGRTPPDEARRIADAYCRRLGLPPACDEVLEFLTTHKAGRLSITDVDELLQWGAALGGNQ